MENQFQGTTLSHTVNALSTSFHFSHFSHFSHLCRVFFQIILSDYICAEWESLLCTSYSSESVQWLWILNECFFWTFFFGHFTFFFVIFFLLTSRFQGKLLWKRSVSKGKSKWESKCMAMSKKRTSFLKFVKRRIRNLFVGILSDSRINLMWGVDM